MLSEILRRRERGGNQRKRRWERVGGGKYECSMEWVETNEGEGGVRESEFRGCCPMRGVRSFGRASRSCLSRNFNIKFGRFVTKQEGKVLYKRSSLE